MLIWLLASAIFALYAYIEIRRDYYGQVYEGRVIDKQVRTSRRGRYGSRTNYYVHYAYDAGGSRQYGRDSVDGLTFDQTPFTSPPGAKVKIKSTKVLGTYFDHYFLNEYSPGLLFIVTLATASAGCASFSLYCLCSAVSRPLNWKKPTRRERAKWQLSNTNPSGEIPQELLQQVPRQVRSRQSPVRGFAIFALLPFLMAGGLLGFAAVRVGFSRGITVGIVIGAIALLWECVWLIWTYSFCIEPGVEKRLCQWGVPVTGRIVRKWKSRWLATSKQPTRYLEYQYDHPGLGQRKRSVLVWPKQFNDAVEGQIVTVLCYPHRRWPTRVYEYTDSFRCA